MSSFRTFQPTVVGVIFLSLAALPGISQSGCGWSALGSGLVEPFAASGGWVTAMAAFDDGGGSQLYAAGNFLQAGGLLVPGLARWDGSAWSAWPTVPPNWGNSTIWEMSMEVLDDGTGPALYFGTIHVQRYDGASWTVLANVSSSVPALEMFDDGSGTALYAAGGFSAIGSPGGPSTGGPLIGRWDGSTWSSVGNIPSSWQGLGDLEVFDDGTGPALYAAGGIPGGVVRWDGSSWSTVGGGLNAQARALAVHDDGSGPALYATGWFSVGGTAGIARWNGSSWTPVGAGLGGNTLGRMAVLDDGSGPALFVFASISPGLSLQKWTGASWVAVGAFAGGGSGGGTGNYGRPVTVYDDGVTAGLYVGHSFTSVSGVSANNIARWSCTPLISQYQTNNVLSTLTLNGVWGTPYAAATVTVPVNVPTMLSLSSLNLGMLWELGFGLAPLVPVGSGALVTPSNQFLNLDLTDPTFATLWNFFQGPGFQNVVIPFSVSSQVSLSAQMLVLEPALPSGVALSQPSRLVVQ